jgi:hypothetical protein
MRRRGQNTGQPFREGPDGRVVASAVLWSRVLDWVFEQYTDGRALASLTGWGISDRKDGRAIVRTEQRHSCQPGLHEVALTPRSLWNNPDRSCGRPSLQNALSRNTRRAANCLFDPVSSCTTNRWAEVPLACGCLRELLGVLEASSLFRPRHDNALPGIVPASRGYAEAQVAPVPAG